MLNSKKATTPFHWPGLGLGHSNPGNYHLPGVVEQYGCCQIPGCGVAMIHKDMSYGAIVFSCPLAWAVLTFGK